jgi:methylmalonyl-CoA mutase
MEDGIHKPDELDIATEFPPPTWEEWKKAVEESLKGVPFEKAMITKTYEGIDLQPIYRKADIQDLPHLHSLPGQAPFVRGNKAEGYTIDGWLIAQQQNAWKPEDANQIILDELNRGLTAVNLKLDKFTQWATIPSLDAIDPDGIWLNNLEDVSILLRGIDLQAVPLLIDGGEASPVILGLIAAYLKQNEAPYHSLHGFIGFDLLASLMEDGELPFAEADMWLPYYQLRAWTLQNAPHLRTILLDGTFWGNRGVDSLTELAYVISTANEYIKAILDKGLSIEHIVPGFQINLTLGANLFMEIAKVRATRLLWAELMKAYNVPEELRKVWIHGVTSSFNKTLYDPFVNVLRTATESFSGIIGGLDSLEVQPFDSRIRPDEEFSRRLARNQQIILMEEAHLSKVTDPAGGCYYIEVLTAQLAEKAWKKMQSIEAKGGLYQAVKAGEIQAEVSRIALERMNNANKRKDLIVGVNVFANPLEQPLETTEGHCRCNLQTYYEKVMEFQDSHRPGLETALCELQNYKDDELMIDFMADAFLAGSTLEEAFDRILPEEGGLKAVPLNQCYAAMGLENLRCKVTDYQQSKQTVLSVFLANLGPLSQHKARADFSTGFLQVGGFYVAGNDGFANVEEAVEAAVMSQAQAVCICSTDDTYPELVPMIISSIKIKKPDMVFLLAGFPQDKVETYKQQGIDIFIHLKANALDTLTDLAQRMGVEL